MEKIASFTIDHIKLEPGVYVSRKDTVGAEVITTFDLRMTSPNDEPVMNTAEMHTIEHLAATFLRNHAVYGSKTIYFGPMGCRTGFYLLLAGDYESKDIVGLMIEMFEFIRDFKGDVPGASPKDCGNYLDMNLGMANYLANRYLENTLYHIDEKHLVYPEESCQNRHCIFYCHNNKPGVISQQRSYTGFLLSVHFTKMIHLIFRICFRYHQKILLIYP